MDFGKVLDPDAVDFSLPAEPAISARTLARGRPDGKAWLHVGAPMWARPDWVGSGVYPSGTSQAGMLQAYARRFTTVELNATFYQLPEPPTLASWVGQTPPGFIFVPKLNRAISHDQPISASGAAARSFMQRMPGLGARLGPCFLQLPPWVGPADLPALAELCDGIADLVPPPGLHLEFRHPDCFVRPGALDDEIIAGLARRRLGSVITCAAGRRDVCHAALTVPEVIVRFCGNGRAHAALDRRRITSWLERLDDWHARGLERAFFFVHQPDDAEQPELVLHAVSAARGRGLVEPEASRPGDQLDLW
jgi:uncharacterized protein YecE (DUF72 family)